MVAELGLIDAARRYTQQGALLQEFGAGIHAARRAAEHVQNDSHAGHPEEEFVHDRVDDDPFEEEDAVDEVVVVDGNSAVVVDEQAAPGLVLGQVFQAADFVAVPEPGVSVPKGGDNMAARLPKVSVLKLWRGDEELLRWHVSKVPYF